MKKILFLLLFTSAMYGQIVPTGQEQDFDYGIKNTASQLDDNAVFITVQNSDGVQGKSTSSVWAKKIYVDNADAKKAFLSTGLIKNGLIQTGTSTTFNITAGIGVISNFDDPNNPTSTIVSFPAFTGITPTYLTSGNITYVAINSSAAVVMQASPFTYIQRRDLIILGAVIHSNLTTINLVNNISAPTNADTNQLHDLMEAIGALNVDGNKIVANNANLSINKTAGDIFKLGVNFANDWKNPHKLNLPLQTLATFRYRTQNGTEGANVTVLNPALYDVANVLTSVPSNKFSIQTVTLFQTGAIRVQYGQATYATLSEAESAINTRTYNVEPNIAANGITRAYIILKNTATSLQNAADTKIVEAGKFGNAGGSGGAITLDAIVAALGFTPENVANKQNSLAFDGTGTKYPTVDAVNTLKWIKSNESLTLAQRKGDDLYGILDQYTGEEITLSKVTGTPTVDGIIYFQLGSEYFKRNYTGGVNAKWFGALGDGIANDNMALQKWLNYAGELYLPYGIYLTNKQLQIFSKLSIKGTGTIKRANMVSTTTATNITTATNPTAITVADASQFSVGMFVTVTTGVNNLDGCYNVHAITSIVGNVITVNNNFTRAFPSGGTLVSHHALLSTYLTPDEIKIDGITLDGNRQNNALYTSWQVNSSLYLSTSNGYIKNCKIINSQADGVVINGSNVLVDKNYINNSGGNAIHLSGIAFSTITNNKLTNANMANVLGDNNSGAGHSEGIITWSELVSDIVVDGNYFDTGRSIIGGIGGSTNNDVQFINNVCKNALYFGIEVAQSSVTPEDGKNFIISNNKFFSCKQLYFSNTSASSLPETMGIKNIIINGNHLIDTWIYSNRTKYMVITNNIFEQNVTTAQNIYMDNYQHLNISSNTIKGGSTGVYLSSVVKSGTLLVGDQVIISNNLFTNQKDYGVFFASSAGKMHSYISVQNNNIFNAGINNSYIAIQTVAGTTIKNNNINVVTNGKGINCIGDSVSTPVGIQGAIVLENNILVPSGGSSYSVNIAGGNSKCIIKFNTWSRVETNAEPLYNIVKDNYKFGDPNGLSTEFLKADGSVDSTVYASVSSPSFTGTPTAPTATAGTNTTQIATTAFVQANSSSGTYTPTLTNTTNITSSTLNSAYYVRNGNIVTVTIAVQLTLTATTETVFTFSLPISGATVVNGIGQGNMTSGGGAVNGYGIVDITNSTTAQLRMGSPAVLGSGSGIANIMFTYSL